MARSKGTLSLSSNIEPSMNAPLDARTVVNTLADLTDSGSFPYFYEGMLVSCKANKKVYQLIGDDPTDTDNWQEVGSSGGGSQVSITPTLTSGRKIADFEIDGEAGELYIPSASGGGNAIIISSSDPSGEATNGDIHYKVSEIEVSDTSYIIATRSTSSANASVRITKTVAGVSTYTDYVYTSVRDTLLNIDGIFNFGYMSNGTKWHIEIISADVSQYPYGEVIEWGFSTSRTINLTVVGQVLFNVQAVWGYADGWKKLTRGENFSTDEVIVGTWIDGRPVYQKTLALTKPTWSGTDLSTICYGHTDIGANVDFAIDSKLIMKTSNGSSFISDQYIFEDGIMTTTTMPVKTCRMWVKGNTDTTGHPNTVCLAANNSNYCSSSFSYFATIKYVKVSED